MSDKTRADRGQNMANPGWLYLVILAFCVAVAMIEVMPHV